MSVKDSASNDSPPLLEVRDLSISVGHGADRVNAVEGVSFTVPAGAAIGLVGESGSGKSLTLRAILGLLPAGAQISGGSVRLSGRELVGASSAELRRARGGEMSMIFQEPMTALNPVVRIGPQIVDGARRRHGWSRAQANAEALRLAREMGIADAEAVLSLYPHELSGGLRQRVMIAAALANRPQLLLCDEPTTALDVTIQDQIVKLLIRLRSELSMSLLYVTHDLAVVAQLCRQVEVMYAGRVVERGDVADVFRKPQHPYTRGLINATPRLERQQELVAIPGSAPSVFDRPSGCAFRSRCALADADCAVQTPTLQDVGVGRQTACLHHERLTAETEGVH